MKHTPGPWQAVEYGGYFMLQTTEFYSDIDDVLDREKDKNAEHNAKLAAASPELLEALIDLLDAQSLKKPLIDSIEKAQIAIKKATE
jgi:predicted nucleotidyltransferase